MDAALAGGGAPDPFEENLATGPPGSGVGVAPSAGSGTGGAYGTYGGTNMSSNYPGYTGYGTYPTYGYGSSYYSGAFPRYSPYGAGYSLGGAYNRAGYAAPGAQYPGAVVLSGVHDAMQRFARVSSMVEEVLRNLHMLFDAMFGLGCSLGAFRQEARMWLAVKQGPAAFVARLLKRIARLWKLLFMFIMSPVAGRFSPVAVVLRILGLVPEDDINFDAWLQAQEHTSGANYAQQDVLQQENVQVHEFDGSNL